ncbi:hypothetical protein FSARC_6189 [Fusarium sarcochroum]|uniref:DUF7587 domain-containing protein n=1 Tax=Fusarium sarcochroum TaxID=1208366 RepID=A0A8H4X8P2_9HYPO|nr:hypothetical protein FSARC_6189 [Fusarium sarcochroum]
MTFYRTSSTVSARLNTSPDTDDIFAKSNRDWSPLIQALCGENVDVPLLRTWDDYSGSQPDEISGAMYARALKLPLNTFEARKSSLQIHIDHKNWKPTPYISFTSSPAALRDLANYRKHRPYRDSQTITVIDPAVRLQAGWPIICFGDEMRHYGTEDPYGMADEELRSHYLCLWRVLESEIVGHWNWDDLSSNPNWYRDTILPAFREFREQKLVIADDDQVDVLSSAINSLGLDDDTPSSESPSSSSGYGSSDEEKSGVLEERELIERTSREKL